MANRTAYTAQIHDAATVYHLDPDLFEALVICESAGHADAFRFEPQYAIRYHMAEKFPLWPVRATAASYGLTQIMFPTVVEFGYTGPPEGLFEPRLNLDYGGRYLHACLEWAIQVTAPPPEQQLSALAAYNGGRNSAQRPPRPKNIAYALRIREIMATLAPMA